MSVRVFEALRAVMVATLILGLCPTSVAAQEVDSPITKAQWLAGCWEQRVGERVTTEMWMPAAGGMMIGASRTVSEGTAQLFEHLRINTNGPRLVYTAIPSGQREAIFTTPPDIPVGPDSLVFENPTHDFPTRIIYLRRGRDSLIAHVEGPGPAGNVRAFAVRMARVRCEASPG